MDDDGTPTLEDGDVADLSTHQAKIHDLLADGSRPKDDSEAMMRWFTEPNGGSSVRAHLSRCDGCKRAVDAYRSPDAAETDARDDRKLCQAAKKQYYKVMAKRRQTLHRSYAEYMNLMPAHVGGVLILRGIADSSTAVEEVQGCTLHSAAGNSVMEYVNHLRG